MFARLQQKWKVGPVQIVLIIFCFALGGSLTGYSAKKIMDVLSVEKDWLWTIIYILLVTMIWPLAVLTISLFFGQFKFFRSYVARISQRIGVIPGQQLAVQGSGSAGSSRPGVQNSGSIPSTQHSPLATNIAIFASGAGSNAQKIIDHFRGSGMAKIALIVCNRKKAGVLQIAEKEHIPFLVIEKEKFFSGNGYLDELASRKIDFLVLAGFLWKIPERLIRAFPKRIINIHPALLPKYGGQGM